MGSFYMTKHNLRMDKRIISCKTTPYIPIKLTTSETRITILQTFRSKMNRRDLVDKSTLVIYLSEIKI